MVITYVGRENTTSCVAPHAHIWHFLHLVDEWGGIELVKIVGHATRADVVAGCITSRQKLGNGMADARAREGAGLFRPAAEPRKQLRARGSKSRSLGALGLGVSGLAWLIVGTRPST